MTRPPYKRMPILGIVVRLSTEHIIDVLIWWYRSIKLLNPKTIAKQKSYKQYFFQDYLDR
jgi:hypothetical protein